MTKGELKNILGVLDAAGVPDSAAIKAGSYALVVSPTNLEGPGIVYSLDGEGHWVASSGSASLTTAVVLSLA